MALHLRDVLPPILVRFIRHISRRPENNDIFDGEGHLFKEAVAGCKLYGEYGMGSSTKWVLSNTEADVIAVDSSQEWVNKVVSANNDPTRLSASWIDVGPIGDWGRPRSYSKKENFSSYAEALWQTSQKPQVVLIDGRFRVCCFLQSLLCSDPGTVIIFDDYTGRPHYHLVEEFVKPTAIHGRQAMFITPANFDRSYAENLRDKFVYVID